MTIDDFVELHHEKLPVSVLCAAIGHRRSTYYARRNKPDSCRVKRDEALARHIAKSRLGKNHVRGRRNVKEALRRKGIAASEGRIGRVMKSKGWYGVPRSSRPRPALPLNVEMKDLVQRRFSETAPNRTWWGDVTEIPTRQGILYLASLEDAFSRFIVGFSLSLRNDTDLVRTTLSQATKKRRPARGLIHHTDRGSPYLSWSYQREVAHAGMRPSVGQRKTSADNAAIESFHSTLERELLAFSDFQTFRQATTEVTAWIHHYNRRRYHSSLGRVSPAEFERRHA